MIRTDWARAFLRIALAVLVVAVFAQTRADPDLWGNVRFGRDIVAARSVHLTDPYSFTADRPWTNHEWLGEVFIYGAYAVAGGFGLVALKLALLLLVVAAAIVTMRAAQIAPAARDLLIGVLLLGSVPQTLHVRPQLFSLALFAWLLAALIRVARGRERWVWLAPPLMLVWASTHGGWVVGAGTLGAWAAASVIAPIGRRERAITIGAAAIAIAATALNPYGVELWSFVWRTVGFDRVEIADWQPIYRIGTAYLLLWLLVAGTAAVAAWSAVRSHSVDPRAFAVVAMLAVGSFRVNRLLAFFAIAVVLLMHEAIASAFAGRRREAPVRPLSAARLGAAVAIGVAILIGSVSAAVRNAGCVRIEADGYPDPGIAAVVSAQHLHGRMLTWFPWGHYAIWYFTPAVRVSIDGRRETVYSDDEMARHLQFYFAPERRQSIVDALAPDYVWVPPHLPVVDRLRADGWKTVFAGPESVLLARRDLEPAPTASWVPSTGPRCFPGP